jgi:hypothetical protein
MAADTFAGEDAFDTRMSRMEERFIAFSVICFAAANIRS